MGANNKKKKYYAWIIQVINGIEQPVTTRSVLAHWDTFAPARYHPQMNMLHNMMTQMAAKGLLINLDKPILVESLSSRHTYTVQQYMLPGKEEE